MLVRSGGLYVTDEHCSLRDRYSRWSTSPTSPTPIVIQTDLFCQLLSRGTIFYRFPLSNRFHEHNFKATHRSLQQQQQNPPIIFEFLKEKKTAMNQFMNQFRNFGVCILSSFFFFFVFFFGGLFPWMFVLMDGRWWISGSGQNSVLDSTEGVHPPNDIWARSGTSSAPRLHHGPMGGRLSWRHDRQRGGAYQRPLGSASIAHFPMPFFSRRFSLTCFVIIIDVFYALFVFFRVEIYK